MSSQTAPFKHDNHYSHHFRTRNLKIPSQERKGPWLTHSQVKARGFIKTGAEIIKRETPLGLYKGLGAVTTGIVPKMAIRFTSFEAYKKLMADKETGVVSSQATFLGKHSVRKPCILTSVIALMSRARCGL